MGRRGEQLQRLFDGVSKGDPAAILTVVVIVVAIGAVLYFKVIRKSA